MASSDFFNKWKFPSIRVLLPFPKTKSFEPVVAVTVNHSGSTSGRIPSIHTFGLLLRLLAKHTTGRKRGKRISPKPPQRWRTGSLQAQEQWRPAGQHSLPAHHSFLFPRLEFLWVLWARSNWGFEFPALPTTVKVPMLIHVGSICRWQRRGSVSSQPVYKLHVFLLTR